MRCTVCGQCGTRGHDETSLALCAEHAGWWREALTERTDDGDWDGEGDLRTDAHDDLMQDMRRDYAEAPEGLDRAFANLDMGVAS